MKITPIANKTKTGRTRNTASKYKDFTLQKRMPIAVDFSKSWKIGDVLTIEDFEEWAVDKGYMPKVDAGEEVNPWVRARQRVDTREEINRGGL